MTHVTYPTTIEAINAREWATFQPFYEELQQRPLSPDTVRPWLADWSHLQELLGEASSVIYVEKTLDTTDAEKEQAYLDLVNNVSPQVKVAEQSLKKRLLALNLPDADIALMLRQLEAEAALFRDENVPILTELARLSNEYDKITGGLKTEWDGQTKNLSQLGVFLRDPERAVRKRAWHTIMDLWLEEREPLNELYTRMLRHRHQVAHNAGLPDYRAYIFQEYGRFDYTPDDCYTFHEAIESVVVPAAARVYERQRARLGLPDLRPWDVDVDSYSQQPLKPYQGQEQLFDGSLRVFEQVDETLAGYFRIMGEENLLDLETRPGKALGGYCTTFALRKRPFIFMNGVGIHDDVQTLLHEAGHAFHIFESESLPLIWQREIQVPMEFCEVASMSMELLAAPYLTKANGSFYNPDELARARIEHLEGILKFLPYMAVVDAFQHWVYTHPEQAASADRCDATWDALWQRFMPGINWNGFEDSRVSGWQRKPHIFEAPFYYIEYGMAQVGALQVWRNSLTDPAAALQAYRQALALGGTQTLPDLFAAAGAEFRFDTAMLAELVDLIETTVAELVPLVS
ncbi:MAG: M3 family oligoendopeptidase [Chloroflexota bacterium]|jgi:oligoendopeptidase F